MGIKEALESERLLAQRTIEVAPQHRRRLSAISVAQIGNAANLHRVSQSQPFRLSRELKKRKIKKRKIACDSNRDFEIMSRCTSPHSFSPDCGRVELVCGPMFAGKSTELLRRLRRFELAGKRCLIVKHAADAARSGDAEVTTHDDRKSSDAVAIPTGELLGVETRAHDVVGIDEGQFFGEEELVSFCNRAADEGAIVIVAALDGDFRRKPFPSIARLFCLAESVRICVHCASARAGAEAVVHRDRARGSDAAVCAQLHVYAWQLVCTTPSSPLRPSPLSPLPSSPGLQALRGLLRVRRRRTVLKAHRCGPKR